MRLFNKAEPQAETQPEIIIAEDDEMQTLFLRTILEHNNFRVTAASNGVNALRALEMRHKDLLPLMVISDIMMPEMDGYTLCRKIKENEALQAIPVILMTSLTDPNEVVKGLYVGADALIAKPYDESFLISSIEQIRLSKMTPVRRDPATGEEIGMRISIGGEKFTLTPERHKTAAMLMSSYEIAVRKNRELAEVKKQLGEKELELEEARRTIEQLQSNRA